MQKNVAGQKLTVFAFDSTTNLPKTGDAANLTAYVAKDDGSLTALGDTSATEISSSNAAGKYTFDLAQSETNANKLDFSAKSSTANVVVVAPTLYTQPANYQSLAIDSNGVASADVASVDGDADAAAALKDEYATIPALPVASPVARFIAGHGMYDSDVGGSLVTATSGTVGRFEDQSGNGNHLTQSTSGDRPFYDAERNLLTFPENDNTWMGGTLAGNRNSLSVFVIGDLTPRRRGFHGSGFAGTSGMQSVVSFDTLGTPTLLLVHQGLNTGGPGNPGCLSVYDGVGSGDAVYTHTTQRVPSSLAFFGVTGGSSYQTYVHKKKQTGKSVTSGTFAEFFLGYDPTNRGLHGNIREVLVYDRTLSDAEVAALADYAERVHGVVDPDEAPVVFIADGDSITSGVGTTLNRNWFAQMIARTPNVVAYNNAEASIYALTLDTYATIFTDALYNPTARNVYWLFAGTNDIALGSVTGTVAYDRLMASYAARKSAGADRVVIVSMLPRNSVETARGVLNSALRAAFPLSTPYGSLIFTNTDGDFLVDIGNHPTIGQSGQNDNATYYSTDDIHLNEEGARVLAETAAPLARALAQDGMVAIDQDKLAAILERAELYLDASIDDARNDIIGDINNVQFDIEAVDEKLGTPQDTIAADLLATKEVVDEKLDVPVSSVEGGGATQPRINRKPSPGFTTKISRRADGTYKATMPIRLTAGDVDEVFVFVDMSPLFGTEDYVETVGTPVVSDGDLTAAETGPRDTYAVVELGGEAAEDCTVTVPVTMTSGTTVPVVFDVEVLE